MYGTVAYMSSEVGAFTVHTFETGRDSRDGYIFWGGHTAYGVQPIAGGANWRSTHLPDEPSHASLRFLFWCGIGGLVRLLVPGTVPRDPNR